MTEALVLKASNKPFTALHVLGDYLIAASGFHAYLLSVKNKEILSSWQVFESQSIHGFSQIRSAGLNDSEILIWGGRLIRRANLQLDDRPTIQLEGVIKCTDWILDVSASHHLDTEATHSYLAVAITAHNDIFGITIENEAEILGYGSPTILYSAHALWLSSDTIIIASGTAFGDIIVRTCKLRLDAPCEIQTHYVFSGHEGSIFGVQISESIKRAAGTHLRLLSSCSDDRTVRVWDISDLSSGISTDVIKRETGFSSNQSTTYLASATGHGSRVWGLGYFCTGNQVQIISTGEDAASCLWRLISHPTEPATTHNLDLLHTVHAHAGKNIWSFTYSPDRNDRGRSVILTGGADGAISAFEIPNTSKPQTTKTWTIQDLREETTENLSIQPAPEAKRRDHFRAVTLIKGSRVLIISDAGQIFLSNQSANNSGEIKSWKLLQIIPALSSYCIAASTSSGKFSIIGGTKGLYYFDSRTDKVYFLLPVSRKLTGIWVEERESKGESCELNVIFAMVGHPHLYVIGLRAQAETKFEVHSRFYVNNNGRSLTSAALSIHQRLIYLALGFRNGALTIYTSKSLEDVTDFATGDVHELATTMLYDRVFSPETITHLKWIPDTQSQASTLSLISVARDRCCSIHEFPSIGHPSLIHRLAMPFGPNIEGLWIHPSRKSVVVYGFHSTDFIVYDVTTSQTLASIPCGGAHRTWSLLVTEVQNLAQYTFTWTQAHRLRIQSVTEPSYQPIKSGGHGQKITTCAVAPVTLPNTSGPLMATGSEDTDIRLFREDGHQFHCLAIMRKHNTGIQCLKWSDDGRYLFSSGGIEELYVWRMTPAPIVHVGVVCEAKLPVDSVSELRITALDIQRLDKASEAFLVNVIYSNSTFKAFLYNAGDENKWQLLAQTQYTAACFTQTFLLRANRAAMDSLVLTTSTDGNISVWQPHARILPSQILEVEKSVVSQYDLLATKALHQSTVNACCVAQVEPTLYVVITGGDDNAVSFTLLHIPQPGLPIKMKSTVIPKAHAAAVTAVVLFHDRSKSDAGQGRYELMAVTTGPDQRIKTWKIVIESMEGIKCLSVQKYKSAWTAVADIAHISPLPSSQALLGECRFILCGAGLEAWTLNTLN